MQDMASVNIKALIRFNPALKESYGEVAKRMQTKNPHLVFPTSIYQTSGGHTFSSGDSSKITRRIAQSETSQFWLSVVALLRILPDSLVDYTIEVRRTSCFALVLFLELMPVQVLVLAATGMATKTFSEPSTHQSLPLQTEASSPPFAKVGFGTDLQKSSKWVSSKIAFCLNAWRKAATD